MIREMRDCEWKTNFSEFSCLSPFVFVFWQFAFDCPDDRLENSMMKGMTDVESWLMHFFIVQKIISGSFSRIREFEFSVRLNAYFASTSLDGFGFHFCRSSQSSKHEFLSMTSNIVLAVEFSGFSRSSYVMFPCRSNKKFPGVRWNVRTIQIWDVSPRCEVEMIAVAERDSEWIFQFEIIFSAARRVRVDGSEWTYPAK